MYEPMYKFMEESKDRYTRIDRELTDGSCMGYYGSFHTQVVGRLTVRCQVVVVLKPGALTT